MVTNYQQSFSEVSHFRGRHFRGFTVLIVQIQDQKPLLWVLFLTLFETGGGKFAPDATNLSAISVPNVLGSPKFMTLFHSMSDLSQRSYFSNFQIFFENIEGRQKYPKGGPFYAKIKDFKKKFFFLQKSYFFNLKMNCT